MVSVSRARLAAAARALDVLPRRMPVERIARLVEGGVRRQLDGQILVGHGNGAALLAMDDRDRAAPVALTRDAPVAQAVVHLARADRLLGELGLFQAVRRFLEGLFGAEPVEERRIDHRAVAVEGLVLDGEGRGVFARRQDHRPERQIVLAGEIEVALVAGRAAEDGARAVVHQDEVGDVDGQRPVLVERMHGADAGVEALLLGRLQLGDGGAHVAAFLAECRELGIVLGRRLGERMVGSERDERRAEQRVGARRVDLDLGLAFGRRLLVEREADQQAFGAADPVRLHQAHLLRPLVERLQRLEQLVGIVGDLEEPLGQLALLDERAGAPAAAVDHLLVGEHGVVDRIPVDLRRFAVGEALLQHVEEELLLVPVVVRRAGGELARPVERQPHRLELPAHGVDVLVGPLRRVHLALHGGVLGRHAEGVPAHRVQHVEALGALVACEHVAHGVVARVADVDAPGRIGKHLEDVALRALVLVGGAEDVVLFPDFLPVLLACGRVVALIGHTASNFRDLEALSGVMSLKAPCGSRRLDDSRG